MKRFRPTTLAAAAVVLALGGALFWRVSAQAPQPAMAAADAARPERVAAAPTMGEAAWAGQAPSTFPVAASDTLMSPFLLQAIKAALGNAQGDTREQKLQSAREAFRIGFPPELQARALSLFDRYVAYQEALEFAGDGDIRKSTSLRRFVEVRDQLRANYFTPEEIAGLWAIEDRNDGYLQRVLAVQENRDLSPEERAAELRAAEEASFPPQEVAARRESVAHLDIEKQTQDFEARHASAEERMAARTEAHGAEAAQRLAQLDERRQDWDDRLSRYAQAPEAQREALAAQLFNESERLRLEGALAMRSSQRQAAAK